MAKPLVTIIFCGIFILVGLYILISAFKNKKELDDKTKIPIGIGKLKATLTNFAFVFLSGLIVMGGAPFILWTKGYERKIDEYKAKLTEAELQIKDTNRILRGLQLYALDFKLSFPEELSVSRDEVEAQVWLIRYGSLERNLISCKALIPSVRIGPVNELLMRLEGLSLGDKLGVEIVEDDGGKWVSTREVEVPTVYLPMRRAK